jgi:hypothetical protein
MLRQGKFLVEPSHRTTDSDNNVDLRSYWELKRSSIGICLKVIPHNGRSAFHYFDIFVIQSMKSAMVTIYLFHFIVQICSTCTFWTFCFQSHLIFPSILLIMTTDIYVVYYGSYARYSVVIGCHFHAMARSTFPLP